MKITKKEIRNDLRELRRQIRRAENDTMFSKVYRLSIIIKNEKIYLDWNTVGTLNGDVHNKLYDVIVDIPEFLNLQEYDLETSVNLIYDEMQYMSHEYKENCGG